MPTTSMSAASSRMLAEESRGVEGIDGRLEDFYLLLGKLGTAQTADEFLGLAGEHRTAHDFNTAGATCFA